MNKSTQPSPDILIFQWYTHRSTLANVCVQSVLWKYDDDDDGEGGCLRDSCTRGIWKGGGEGSAVLILESYIPVHWDRVQCMPLLTQRIFRGLILARSGKIAVSV